MFLRVYPSTVDKKYLALRSRVSTPISADFSKLMVNKPWGQEYLFFSNRFIEVWHLSIDHLKATSMHCHPNKKTTLVMLEGRAMFSSLNRSIELKPLDAVVIAKGTFHSTQALSDGGVRVLEFETPPMKHDLVRLEDKYGRINKGYESIENMKTIGATLCRLSQSEIDKGKKLNKNHICLHRINSRHDFIQIADERSGILVLLSGKVMGSENKKICQTADVVTTNQLLTHGCTFHDVSVLSIHPYKN